MFGLALRRGMARDNRPPGSRFARPMQGNQGPDEQSTASPTPSAQPAHRGIPRQPQQPPKSQTSAAAHRTPAPSEVQPTNTPSPSETPVREEPTSTTAFSAPPTPEQAKPSSEEPQQVPISSLPDLTQGIPSTLEYETAGTRSRSALSTTEGDGDAAAGAGGRGRGELPASAYITSTERRRQRIANYLFGSILLFAVGGTIYMGRDWNEEDRNRHPNQPNGWGLGLWWNRARTRMREVMTYYHEPAFEKLLPDPDPMFARPYTLCISLEDMLVHSEWSREHGWRVAKRPGVDYFVRYLSQYYELVLFTTVPFAIGEPLVRKLDPFRLIVWPLYREATKYKDGEVVKVSQTRRFLH
jgi:mitochondrial import inner membrane translocase subunit TIM50